MLEHFEDNLNTNITNKRNLANFLKVAKTVRKNLTSQYGADVFSDPAETDPYEEQAQGVEEGGPVARRGLLSSSDTGRGDRGSATDDDGRGRETWHAQRLAFGRAGAMAARRDRTASAAKIGAPPEPRRRIDHRVARCVHA